MSLPALAIGGAGLTAIGTIGQGIAQSQAASYSAQVARNNALTATQNATYAEEAGTVKSESAGRQAAAQLGAVRSGIAASNIDVNSGSALAVQQTQRETGLQSQQTVANNGLLQAYGYRQAATSDTAQAGLLQGEAETAVPGSLLAAGGSLGTNISTIPSKFANLWGTNTGGGMVDGSYPI